MPPLDWIEQEVRASSAKDALDCAMRYEAKQILKVRMPSSGISHLGTALHKGSALYDQSVIDGKPVEYDTAVGAFIDSLNMPSNPDEPLDDGVRWDDDFQKKDAEQVGTRGLLNYLTDIGSKRRYAAVEAKLEKFRIDFPEQRVTIILTGHTDRIRSTVNPVTGAVGHGITDIKSGANRVSKAERKVKTNAEKAQLGIYELVAEKASGLEINMPAEIAGISTAQHASVATVEVPGTRSALVGTAEHPGVLDFLARMLRAGVFPPNPSSNLCSKKFCPIYDRCPYHD